MTGKIVECDRCGERVKKYKVFLERANRHYCSLDCWNLTQIEEAKWSRQAICENCGQNFRSKKSVTKGKEYWEKCCSIECLRKLQESKTIYKQCIYCGKTIRCWPSRVSGKRFCSKDCQFAYKTAVSTTLVRCKCGKEITLVNSRHNENENYFCSRLCLSKYLIRDKSGSWKGGWYLGYEGRYFILVGKYKQKYDGQKVSAYKLRYRAAIELFVGKIMPRQYTILHLNGDIGDDRLANLYICNTFSECKKIQSGSLPFPSRSNVEFFVKHPWNEQKINYNRFSDSEIKRHIENSERFIVQTVKEAS